MKAVDVLGAGIVVADHICTPISHVPRAGELVLAEGMTLASGGCAANTAVDLAKMGVSSSIVGRVGDDLFGNVVGKLLERDGVNTSQLLRTAGSDTSQTLIINVKNEDRRFVHTFGANAQFRTDDISLDSITRSKVLYVGGYLLMPNFEQDGLIRLFQHARQQGVITVLDVGIPGPGEYLSRLEKVLPLVDVFLPNTDEAHVILGIDAPQQQALRFHELGAKTVVITRGEAGSVLVNAKHRLEAGIFRMDYVDGSGSGDAFDAGYIIGLLRGCDETGCLTLASALGASCVRSIGTTAGVFTRSGCEAFLAHNQLKISNW